MSKFTEAEREQAVKDLGALNTEYANQRSYTIYWVDAVDLMCQLNRYSAMVGEAWSLLDQASYDFPDGFRDYRDVAGAWDKARADLLERIREND